MHGLSFTMIVRRISFLRKNYHCGSVDICEDHYDGRTVLSPAKVVEMLVKENATRILEKYAEELHIEDQKH